MPVDYTKHMWLYVLKLEQGKYYVGVTSKTPEERMSELLNDYIGAQWTRNYKPDSIVYKKYMGNVSMVEAEKLENETVREYMTKYGLDNVRGGDLSYTGKYVRIGNQFLEIDWKDLSAIPILLLIVIFLFMWMYFSSK